MENLSLKVKLIEACREALIKVAEQARQEMNDAQNSAKEYGAPKDRYDAFRNQMMTRSGMFARQFEEARRELSSIEKIDDIGLMEEVAFGAVVRTRNQNLFIAAAAGKLDIGGICYQAISVRVPIYTMIKGLRKGDEFEFRGVKNRIEEVF